jgi:2-polyprenyl-3-methyl-5-hydroxy-6-metoxy-1,4-benzoquinol methylase
MKLVDKNCQPGSVLDIGCGLGEFMDMLENKGYKVCGVDMEKNCEKCAAAVNIEVSPLPFEDNMFDIVTSLEVIEHLCDAELYLSEIARVLKPGGILIMTTPNYRSWFFRLLYLIGRLDFLLKTPHRTFYDCRAFYDKVGGYFHIIDKTGLYDIPGLGCGKRWLEYLAADIGVAAVRVEKAGRVKAEISS